MKMNLTLVSFFLSLMLIIACSSQPTKIEPTVARQTETVSENEDEQELLQLEKDLKEAEESFERLAKIAGRQIRARASTALEKLLAQLGDGIDEARRNLRKLKETNRKEKSHLTPNSENLQSE